MKNAPSKINNQDDYHGRTSFVLILDGEFAQVCVATTKAKESIQEFTDLKEKMDEIAAPYQVSLFVILLRVLSNYPKLKITTQI